MKIYNAERREFSIHISVKKFWSENFGQQSEGGKTPDDPDGHLQPDHWFKFVIDFRFRLSCHWRFIDGVVNTFSNAHYSQTPHPNWTKPTQGASGNVRISFGNNMGSKKIWNFSSKCPAWAKCIFIEPFFQFFSSAYWPVCQGKRRIYNGIMAPTGLPRCAIQVPGCVISITCPRTCNFYYMS